MAEKGVQGYLDLGIPASKLILGLPWYGYDYPCVGLGSDDSAFCPIKEIPFRGVNCSDAAGEERGLSNILDILGSSNVTRERSWDHYLQTWYFNYRADDGSIHQIWYDDGESLQYKYDVAKKHKLRGTGPYTYLDLAYDTPTQAAAAKKMWSALASFLH